MTYSLTLITDAYSLRGEIYEREDKKGWEYRLYYRLKGEDEQIPSRQWDSASLSDDEKMEIAFWPWNELHRAIERSEETIEKYFS